jgi:hypothetical protein
MNSEQNNSGQIRAARETKTGFDASSGEGKNVWAGKAILAAPFPRVEGSSKAHRGRAEPLRRFLI